MYPPPTYTHTTTATTTATANINTLVHIWWSELEGVISYCVIDTQSQLARIQASGSQDLTFITQ